MNRLFKVNHPQGRSEPPFLITRERNRGRAEGVHGRDRFSIRMEASETRTQGLPTLYIHNAMQALPGFSFPGIQDYATRALTNTNGIAVIPRGLTEIDDLLGYYHSVGFGVDDVISVPADSSGDLYPALREPKCAETIRRHARQGARIEFFNTRETIEERLALDLGLDWKRDVVSLPSSIAEVGNNKARVRQIAHELGLQALFPPHIITNGREELTCAFERMTRDHGEVVIKRPTWSSGLGMVFGRDHETLRHFLEDNGAHDLCDIIVETSLGRDAVSMTIAKRFEHGVETDCWTSEQDCRRTNGSVAHLGSILGDTPNVTERDAAWMQSATAPLYDHFLNELPTLTGIINWDCIKAPNGERYILEGNLRVTFSTYIRTIQRAIACQRGVPRDDVTCVMSKIRPRPSIVSFASLRRALGTSLLVDPLRTGVVPIVIPCLPRSGYCYVVAVGKDFLESNATLQEALASVS